MPHHHYQKVGAAAPLNRLLYMDLKMCIADNDLFKVNQMAAASGVNVCYPYLDRNLAELTGRIPAGSRSRDFKSAISSKEPSKNFFLKRILRKKKHGFGLTIARWLHTHSGFREMARSLLLDPSSVQRGFIKPWP